MSGQLFFPTAGYSDESVAIILASNASLSESHLLFNLLLDDAVCTAVVLFKFVC
jgi:hypothetical protein